MRAMPRPTLPLLCLPLAVACSTAPTPRSIADAPVFEKGFQIFPSPRTFDPPGTIFRVDPDGVRHPLVDLSGMLSLSPQEESIPRLSVQGMFNTGAFLSWVSGEKRLLQYQRVDSATIAVTGARREQAFEVSLTRVLDSARRVIDWRKSGKVYLITETISARLRADSFKHLDCSGCGRFS